jgi:hypothetical protein
LGEIRNCSKALVDGEFNAVYCKNSAIAYERVSDSSAILVAINNDDTQCKIQVDSRWDNSYCHFEHTCVDGEFNLPPHSYTLLSR